IVDPLPAQRLIGPIACTHRLEHVGAYPHLRMAVHARFRGRDTGKRGMLHKGMAVSAVDAEDADMVLMAERHGLHAGDTCIRAVRPAIDEANADHEPEEEE